MFKMRRFSSLTIVLVVITFVALLPMGNAFAATGSANGSTPYFILNNTLNFTNASGTGATAYQNNTTGDGSSASTQLDQQTIKDGVIANLQHTLFAQDGQGNVTVYMPDNASVAAQVSQNSDGSTNIQFTESTSTITVNFNGTLASDQMTATYSEQTMAGTTVDNQDFMGGVDISASFTTTVNWVTPDQIPSGPSNVQYQLTSDGGVSLAWSPSQSSNVASYDIYRYVLGVDAQPQFIANVTTTSYADESPKAIQNAQTIAGISYLVYAVGPSGVESASFTTVNVSSLPSYASLGMN